MTTPYGLRIVWEFLDNARLISFHCWLPFTGGREEEIDPASEQHCILRMFNIVNKHYYQYVFSSLDSLRYLETFDLRFAFVPSFAVNTN